MRATRCLTYSQAIEQRWVNLGIITEVLCRRAHLKILDLEASALRQKHSLVGELHIILNAGVAVTNIYRHLHIVFLLNLLGDICNHILHPYTQLLAEGTHRTLTRSLIGDDIRCALGYNSANREHAIVAIEGI